VDGIHAARDFTRQALAESLGELLWSRFDQLSNVETYSKSPQAIANRSLRNTCLSYLATSAAGRTAARQQWAGSDNMTDTLAALRALVFNVDPTAGSALQEFEQRWGGNTLVMDKWFALQAMIPGQDAVIRVRDLMGHRSFSLRNPNKVRSLLGAFSILNPTGFHAADGSGYRLVADQVIALDDFNPQMAARLVAAFNRWPRFDAARRRLMCAELERIAAVEGLSTDVFEIVSNALD
jgi:aminopeptidase N